EGRPVLPRQRHIDEFAYALTRDDARVRSLHIPVRLSLGPRDGISVCRAVVAATGSPIAAPTDQGARVPPHTPMCESVPDSTFATRCCKELGSRRATFGTAACCCDRAWTAGFQGVIK